LIGANPIEQRRIRCVRVNDTSSITSTAPAGRSDGTICMTPRLSRARSSRIDRRSRSSGSIVSRCLSERRRLTSDPGLGGRLWRWLFRDAGSPRSIAVWRCANGQRALREFARVTRAGGYVVVSSNNPRRLNRLLDPRFAPLLSPLQDFVRVRRQRRGAPRLKTTLPGSLAGATALISLPELERMLAAAGMSPEKVAGVGFGLLTFMGRVVLRESMAVRVHRFLQVLGSRGVPVIRSIALQHLILAHVGVTETRLTPSGMPSAERVPAGAPG
jgi:hypothetical protein